ncbi:MAG: porin [Muribaculaceae bacterium]|nr:porin [Muribaculaceae bacterium]
MKKYLLTLALLPALAATAQAQNVHPNHRQLPINVIVGEVEDSLKVYEAMVENSPADALAPNAPRFAIVGKNEKFYLGFGGVVKATMNYDWGSVIQNPNEFGPATIPMPGSSNYNKGNNGWFGISAQQTDLFLNFVALPNNPNKIGFYLNATLLGNGYLPQIRSAYVSYRGFEAGYGFSLFTDLAADPTTIDYDGPNSFTVVINAKFDYRHNFGKHFGVGIGAEMPMASYTDATHTQTITQRVPDIPAYLQWNFGNNNRIRFSALLRNMQYRDMVTNQNKNLAGWGVQLTGNFNICNKLIGYYQAAYGKGMTSYFEDLTGGGLDMVPNMAKNGELETVKAWGGYIGLQYNVCPKAFFTAIYSHLRNYAPKYNNGTTPWDDQYRYGQYVLGNFFYNINDLFTWGLEYIWGRRVNMDGLQAHDNRIQTTFQVSF